jgi:uncharacterized protein (DUF2249 family)
MVVELDVRDDLRNGREPFSRIMAAAKDIPAGGELLLRAIFEPSPLYAVMQRHGFSHQAEQVGEGDWSIRFRRDGAASPIEVDAATSCRSSRVP